jgi:hypothetical protein
VDVVFELGRNVETLQPLLCNSLVSSVGQFRKVENDSQLPLLFDFGAIETGPRVAAIWKFESGGIVKGTRSSRLADGLAQLEQPVPQNQTSPCPKPCPIVPTAPIRVERDFVGTRCTDLLLSNDTITGLSASPKFR